MTIVIGLFYVLLHGLGHLFPTCGGDAMIIKHKINMDLQIRNTIPRLGMVCGDSLSRAVEIAMYTDGVAWKPEKLDNVLLRFRKSNGHGGSYDTLPNGTRAWDWEENRLCIQLAPQVLTVEGLVEVQAVLIQGDACLATFCFQIDVEADPAAGVVESEDYINWTAWTKAELDNQLAKAKENGLFDGACFTPYVDDEGNLCWQNDQGKENPPAVDLIALLAEELADRSFLEKSGGTMTGPIVLPAPVEAGHAANKGYVDARHMNAEVTLTASGWTGEVPPYTQTISAEGILATDRPHWGVKYSANRIAALAEKEAFALVDDLDTYENRIVFTCLEEKPDRDLQILLEVNR